MVKAGGLAFISRRSTGFFHASEPPAVAMWCTNPDPNPSLAPRPPGGKGTVVSCHWPMKAAMRSNTPGFDNGSLPSSSCMRPEMRGQGVGDGRG